MLTYNTKLKKIVLPEYGRNIQKMVDHCLTIDDRDRRTKCAYAIVDTLGRLFPPTGDPEEYKRKLWDHLNIMSGFALDIDWPYDVIKSDSLNSLPEPIPSTSEFLTSRQYGRNVEVMVAYAAQMPEGEERYALTLMIANHMKKLLVTSNNDFVEDARIFKDLAALSHGELRLDPETTHLHEYKALAAPTGKKKRKK